jgi:hypothetical protein
LFGGLRGTSFFDSGELDSAGEGVQSRLDADAKGLIGPEVTDEEADIGKAQEKPSLELNSRFSES